MREVTVRFTVVVVLVLGAALAHAASATVPVQPGDGVGSPATCSLGFFYRDRAGVVYASTAAHCVNVGDVVQTHRGKIGTVVFEEGGDTDIALIRVNAGFPWSPTLRALYGPNGYVREAETTVGDLLRASGQGLVLRETEQTQARVGVLVGDTPQEFWWSTVATPGDSGGPVIMHLSGKAIGTIARLGVDRGATDEGPTIPYILERLRAAGYDVGLVMANQQTAY